MQQIKLSQNKTATIDDDDFQRCSEHRWYFNQGKARTTLGGEKVSLHNFIMQTRETVQAVDKNYLNCQKSNLQIKPLKGAWANPKNNPQLDPRYKHWFE